VKSGGLNQTHLQYDPPQPTMMGSVKSLEQEVQEYDEFMLTHPMKEGDYIEWNGWHGVVDDVYAQEKYENEPKLIHVMDFHLIKGRNSGLDESIEMIIEGLLHPNKDLGYQYSLLGKIEGEQVEVRILPKSCVTNHNGILNAIANFSNPLLEEDCCIINALVYNPYSIYPTLKRFDNVRAFKLTYNLCNSDLPLTIEFYTPTSHIPITVHQTYTKQFILDC